MVSGLAVRRVKAQGIAGPVETKGISDVGVFGATLPVAEQALIVKVTWGSRRQQQSLPVKIAIAKDRRRIHCRAAGVRRVVEPHDASPVGRRHTVRIILVVHLISHTRVSVAEHFNVRSGDAKIGLHERLLKADAAVGDLVDLAGGQVAIEGIGRPSGVAEMQAGMRS